MKRYATLANAILLSVVLLLPSAVSAGQCRDSAADCAQSRQLAQAAPAPGIAAPAGDQAVGIPQPLGNVNLAKAIGNAIRVILGLTGSMALIMFIYGGFLYMTAAGVEERVTKGKNTIIWAILGLIAVFSAYAVVDFVIKGLTEVKVESPASASKLGGPDDK